MLAGSVGDLIVCLGGDDGAEGAGRAGVSQPPDVFNLFVGQLFGLFDVDEGSKCLDAGFFFGRRLWLGFVRLRLGLGRRRRLEGSGLGLRCSRRGIQRSSIQGSGCAGDNGLLAQLDNLVLVCRLEVVNVSVAFPAAC